MSQMRYNHIVLQSGMSTKQQVMQDVSDQATRRRALSVFFFASLPLSLSVSVTRSLKASDESTAGRITDKTKKVIMDVSRLALSLAVFRFRSLSLSRLFLS